MSRIPFPDNDTLWREIGELYALEGAAPRCIRVQDSHGLSITLLLLAIVVGRRGIAIHEGALPALRTLVVRWHYNVLVPLRAARRALKDTDSPAYDQARQLELAVERGLLDEAAGILRGRALWNAEDALPRNLDCIVDAHGNGTLDPPDSAYAAAENLGRLLAGH
ncbi:MAG: TIGR02444 family protein [Pseudomonadota bacterium]